MLLVKQQKVQRHESTCICGEHAELRYGTRDFFIGTRKITVQNIPHFYCSRCNKAYYDSNLPVDKLLRYAYLNNMYEIDWNNKERYI